MAAAVRAHHGIGGRKNVPVATPMMGEALDMQAPQAGTRWWETVEL
jgi:hypothetical protein